MSARPEPERREPQLAYSDQQPLMLDEQSRRSKAAKIVRVVAHFLGREDLTGLAAADVGCSAGYTAQALGEAGATVTGVDIDLPALERARGQFAGEGIDFVEYNGRDLPFEDATLDLVVYNHVYEHTVDPDELMREIRRVLRPEGVVYLGLGNRFGLIEPHHRLPFLSWLPRRWSDVYLRSAGRGDHYYERLKTRKGLRRMVSGLTVWEYTYSVLAEPGRFAAGDVVRGPLTRVPPAMWRLLTPVIPTYIWVGSIGRVPQGPALLVPPGPVRTG